MEQNFSVMLEDCLSRLDRGELLLEVLGKYPTEESRLRPLLLIAMLSRALPPPSPKPAAIRKGRNLMLAEMNRTQAEKVTRIPKSRQPVGKMADGWLNPLQPGQVNSLKMGYRLAIVAVVLLMGGSLLTLNASASGMPDAILDNLFNGFEKVRTVLLFNRVEPDELVFDPELTSLDDHLAGNPGDPSAKPGYDPSDFTDKTIPGLDELEQPTKGKNPQVVEDDPYEESMTIGLEDQDEVEDKEAGEDKDKDKDKKDKEKKSKKDKDKVKKDKNKNK
jgi:hypothetical protein